MEYYIKNGKVGVLISPDYGSGWATWNDQYGLDLALDKRIIDKWLTNISSDEMKEYLSSIGYEDVYMGGYLQLILEFVPLNVPFYIKEFDGAEKLITNNVTIIRR